jgi:hypothetical protein
VSGSSHPKMGSIGQELMELWLASWQVLPWSILGNSIPEPNRGPSFKLSTSISHPCGVKSYAAVGPYFRVKVRLISRFERMVDGLQLGNKRCMELEVNQIL